jgi:uncharacterized protein with gpF-like domain
MSDMNPNAAEAMYAEETAHAKRREYHINRMDEKDMLEAVVAHMTKDDARKWLEAYRNKEGYLALRVLEDIVFRFGDERASEDLP